jgi:hypothetical protein
VRLRDGRLVGVSGRTTEWRQVADQAPAWSALVKRSGGSSGACHLKTASCSRAAGGVPRRDRAGGRPFGTAVWAAALRTREVLRGWEGSGLAARTEGRGAVHRGAIRTRGAPALGVVDVPAEGAGSGFGAAFASGVGSGFGVAATAGGASTSAIAASPKKTPECRSNDEEPPATMASLFPLLISKLLRSRERVNANHLVRRASPADRALGRRAFPLSYCA